MNAQHFMTGSKAFLKKNGVLLGVLTVLSIIAAVSGQYFQGQLLFTTVPKGSQASAVLASTRACTSEGTMFADLQRIDAVVDTFQKEASAVTAEREKFLRASSEWSCPLLGDSAEPEMPVLAALTKKLPGWHYPYPVANGDATATVPVQKPSTFDTFDSVLTELLREYECKLSEMQENAAPLILQNADLSGQSFCCNQGVCGLASDQCDGPATQDPMCGGQCLPSRDIATLVTRSDPFYRRITVERNRARYAIDRTIQSLRSYEMQYPITRDLLCFARASLDLRSEMSLLADATSCMPKIWNAATSLHDKQ